MKSLFLLPVILIILFTAPLPAATQILELKTGWNLVSFVVQPQNTAVTAIFDPIIQSGVFESVWTYNAVSEFWAAYPAVVPGIVAIENVEIGKGYWVNVTSSTTLIINSADAIPSGDIELTSGWNLVGFPLQTATDFRNLLSGLPISQIWTYDANAGEFKGIEFAAGTSTTTREDFTLIESGRGYWIYTSQAFILGPVLSTSMESDKDLEPFLEGDTGEGRLAWTEVTLGDEDIGEDGFFDTPATQRAITFRDELDTRQFYINNTGSGILNYTIEVLDPEATPWVRLLDWDEEEEQTIKVTRLTGSVSTNTASIKIEADRTYLAPGDYYADLNINSNGRSEQDPERTIRVHLRVATIEGDYNLIAHIDTINGQSADMYNPRYTLSLYKDTIDPENGSIKGIIDENRSLLMPQRFYMTGQYYEDNGNRFSASGSLILPAKDSPEDTTGLNPYKVDLRRDITLLGDRKGPNDSGIGPLDLKGEYRETIRNVLGTPIYLAGTFVAYRTSKTVSTVDTIESYVKGDLIPDGLEDLEQVITIDSKDRVLITEVDVTPNLEHNRPTDLVVTLESPAGTIVRLREHSDDLVGKITYDDDTLPLDSMDSFVGEKSSGDWILRVRDTEIGETGKLAGCTLNIKGTRVYSVSGTIENVAEGATVLLSGCGETRTTTVDANGYFLFDDLIDCTYSITILQPGYEKITAELTVDGQDLSEIVLDPQKLKSANPGFILGPLAGNAPLTVEMADTTDLSSDINYQHDWIVQRIDIASAPELLTNHNSQVRHTFQNPGVYTVKMEIRNADNTAILYYTVDKANQYVIVGQPTTTDYKVTFYTIKGSGGIPNGKQESAFDSATYDIDRYPLATNNTDVGTEDTDGFLESINEVKQSNTPAIDEQGNVVGNNKLDPPVGENSYHLFVNIGMGQHVIGTSISGKFKLSIGASP